LGLGSLFAWLALRGLDWPAVGRAIGRASILWCLVALVVFCAAGLIRAFRWQILFVRVRVSALRLYLVENAGFGANSISPVRFLGEPVQIGLLILKDRLRSEDVLASLGLNKASDVAVTLAVGVLGLFLFPPLAPLRIHVALAAGGVGAIALACLALLPLSRAFPVLRRRWLVRKFLKMMKVVNITKGRVALSMAMGVAYWLAFGVVGLVIARAVGLSLPFAAILLVAIVTVVFSTSVPGLPGGFGNFEWAAVSLLSLWNIPGEVALTFGLLLHMVWFIPPIIIAAVVLPLDGVRSIKAMRGLVRR
jgi:uncharacterized membrane protein YbhN (UPF0104 family)